MRCFILREDVLLSRLQLRIAARSRSGTFGIVGNIEITDGTELETRHARPPEVTQRTYCPLEKS